MSDGFIICLNIERFRELLLSTKDDTQRKMLLTLIDEQEQKLAGLRLHEIMGPEPDDPENPTRHP
jgi:hypothetical protein